MPSSGPLASIFKAYDVRAVVPDQLNETSAFAIGHGFARFVAGTGATSVLVGRDMRASGVGLSRAFIAGVNSCGLSVTDLGLCSTDLMYFASGEMHRPGAMLTASHNPAQYNGFKMCLADARPIGEESGLLEIRESAEALLDAVPDPSSWPNGPVEARDMLDAFAQHVRSFIDPTSLAGLTVVADAANGMGGLVAPRVFAAIPCQFEMLYGELDGTFPNHPADPIQAENLADLIKAVESSRADVGLAFDGDADRVFLVDEEGVPLSGSTTTAIVAKAMLERHPGATILYNCICSKTVPEVITENGGIGIRTRVGHSFIKAVMADTGAIFGGEHSGHYYFADNYRADSGIIAALIVLEVLARAKVPLSELRRPFERYSASGEINTKVDDARGVIEAVRAHYGAKGASIDLLDGLTVDCGAWWFNLRSSNTEPLLRLNVEAADRPSVDARVQEVLELFKLAEQKG
jgi:phosphomannomutase